MIYEKMIWYFIGFISCGILCLAYKYEPNINKLFNKKNGDRK